MIIQPNIKYYDVKYKLKSGTIVICAFGQNIPRQMAERLRDERQKNDQINKYYIEENTNITYL